MPVVITEKRRRLLAKDVNGSDRVIIGGNAMAAQETATIEASKSSQDLAASAQKTNELLQEMLEEMRNRHGESLFGGR